MCYQGKCLGIKVETGALIYGVIKAVTSGIGAVCCLVALFVLNYINWKPEGGVDDFVLFRDDDELPHKVVIYSTVVGDVLLSLLAAKCLLDFLFAVLLCNGLCKKNPCQVNAYFIYGLVMAVLSGILVIVVFATAELNVAFSTLFAWIIYCLILHMIKLSHQKISEGTGEQFHHKRLVETVY